jgi:hypothetical protein
MSLNEGGKYAVLVIRRGLFYAAINLPSGWLRFVAGSAVKAHRGLTLNWKPILEDT